MIESAKAGVRLTINPTQIAVLTFYFKSKSKTPVPIICNQVIGDEKYFESDVEHSFYLTQCYTGYLNQQIKFPVTAYSAEEIVSEITKFEQLTNLEFFSQWYI